MRFRLSSQSQTIVIRWLVGVWLFAVVQSMAHACVLQQRHGHTGAVPEVADVSAQEHHHSGGDDDADVSEVLCLRTCDDAESAVLGASASWVPDLAVMAPSVFRPWVELSRLNASDQIEGPSPPGAPPPAIRFLRLNR